MIVILCAGKKQSKSCVPYQLLIKLYGVQFADEGNTVCTSIKRSQPTCKMIMTAVSIKIKALVIVYDFHGELNFWLG